MKESILNKLNFNLMAGFWLVSMVLFMSVTKINRSSSLFTVLLFIPISTYLLCIVFFETRDFTPNQRERKIIWILSIGIRFLIIFFPVGLSDDIYRYIWDGYLQHNGINPYLYSPNASQVLPYRTSWWKLINNRDVSTPYPPFSQVIFFMITSFQTSLRIELLMIRLLMICFDLGTIRVLEQILQKFELPSRRLIYYAWSPLSIFEFAGNGHNDIIAIFFMLISIFFVLQKQQEGSNLKQVISPISLAFGILSKYFPLIILPFIFFKWNLKQRIIFFSTMFLTIIPYVHQNVNPIIPQGQLSFIQYFRFNESIFRIVFFSMSYLVTNPDLWTRLIYVIFMVTLSGFSLVQFIKNNMKDIDIIRFGFVIMFFGLLFGPDVQPWYILWILPLGIIIFDPTSILYSNLILFSYQIYVQYDSKGIWYENPVILLIQYIPVYLFLIYLLARGEFAQYNAESIGS